MTATLLIQLNALLQAWGAVGQYGGTVETMPRPTKSGVLGMVANALGRDYSDDMSDLSSLRFAVRTEKQGRIFADYRTAGGGKGFGENYSSPSKMWDGRAVGNAAKLVGDVSLRTATYLEEAAFTVSLTGDGELLAQIRESLIRPARPVFLGRKSCPVEKPLVDDESLLSGDQHTMLAETAEGRHVWVEDRDGDICYENPARGRDRRFGPVRIRHIREGGLQ